MGRSERVSSFVHLNRNKAKLTAYGDIAVSHSLDFVDPAGFCCLIEFQEERLQHREHLRGLSHTGPRGEAYKVREHCSRIVVEETLSWWLLHSRDLVSLTDGCVEEEVSYRLCFVVIVETVSIFEELLQVTSGPAIFETALLLAKDAVTKLIGEHRCDHSVRTSGSLDELSVAALDDPVVHNEGSCHEEKGRRNQSSEELW